GRELGPGRAGREAAARLRLPRAGPRGGGDHARGLRVIPILAYGHPDYSSRGAFVGGTPLGGGIPPFYVANAQYFPPDNPADFARYARTVAHHYRRQAIGFEIWNEQNEGWRFWPPHEDPAAYGRLLCA